MNKEMNNDMLPVGTTFHVNPEDIKWELKGDTISREALKEVLKECAYSYDGVNTWIMKDEVLGIIDNAPTVEERPQDEWICPNCDFYEQAENNYCQYAGKCTIACHKCRYFKQKDGVEK